MKLPGRGQCVREKRPFRLLSDAGSGVSVSSKSRTATPLEIHMGLCAQFLSDLWRIPLKVFSFPSGRTIHGVTR